MYLPANTPSRSISAGVSCGLNSGIEAAPGGGAQHVAVALLHLVIDGDGAFAHGGKAMPRRLRHVKAELDEHG